VKTRCAGPKASSATATLYTTPGEDKGERLLVWSAQATYTTS